MKEGYEPVTSIDVYSSVQGRSTVVETSYGPIHVLVSGDESKHPCVTFPEAGVNSLTCFQNFFSASDPKKSLLVQSFCFYHFDYPGCEVPQQCAGAHGGPSSSSTAKAAPSLHDLGMQVGEAMKQLGLKKAMGMGVGAGGYILTKAALGFPKLFAGLILFAPCAKKANWLEYSYGKILENCLWFYGWRSRFAHKHLYQRLFSSRITSAMAADDGYGVSDLLYTFNQEVEKIDPRAIMKYLQAVLRRESILDELKDLKTRVLLFSCVDSIYCNESLEMNLKLDQTKSDFIEVFDSGTLVTEQLPQETLRPIDQFVALLQQNGLCR